jgi:hypothetical protein
MSPSPPLHCVFRESDELASRAWKVMAGMRAMEFCHVTAVAYVIDDQNGRTNAVVTLRVADHASPIQGNLINVKWPHPAYSFGEFLVEAG